MSQGNASMTQVQAGRTNLPNAAQRSHSPASLLALNAAWWHLRRAGRSFIRHAAFPADCAVSCKRPRPVWHKGHMRKLWCCPAFTGKGNLCLQYPRALQHPSASNAYATKDTGISSHICCSFTRYPRQFGLKFFFFLLSLAGLQ